LKRTVTTALLFLLTACSTTTQPTSNSQPGTASQPAAASQPAQPAASAKPVAELKEGEASGTILVEGQTIAVNHAYAGRGEMFGEEATLVLLTEKPVTDEGLSGFFDDKFGSFPKDNNGLQYKVGTGFWVMYHPGSLQTSGINTLKEWSVENGMVKGRDEYQDDFDNKVYKRSVTFLARIRDKAAK
jgi:hypothetical protein